MIINIEYLKDTEEQLKPCPFCGKQPQIVLWKESAIDGAKMTLQCCMEFRIEEDEPTRFYSMVDGKTQLNIMRKKSVIDIWNSRVGEETDE